MKRKTTKNMRNERERAKIIVLEFLVQLLMMVQIYLQRILILPQIKKLRKEKIDN